MPFSGGRFFLFPPGSEAATELRLICAEDDKLSQILSKLPLEAHDERVSCHSRLYPLLQVDGLMAQFALIEQEKVCIQAVLVQHSF